MNRGFGIYCFLLNVVTFAIPYGLGWHLSTLQTGWLSARKWTCCAWVRWYDAYLTMLVSRGYVRIDLLSFCLILSLTIVHMLLAFCNLRTSIIFWLVVSAFFRQILHFNPSYNCLMFGSQLTSISFGYLWMVWNHKTIYVYIYTLNPLIHHHCPGWNCHVGYVWGIPHFQTHPNHPIYPISSFKFTNQLPVTEAFIVPGVRPCSSQRTWKRIDTYRFPKSIPRGSLQFVPFGRCGSFLLNVLRMKLLNEHWKETAAFYRYSYYLHIYIYIILYFIYIII